MKFQSAQCQPPFFLTNGLDAKKIINNEPGLIELTGKYLENK